MPKEEEEEEEEAIQTIYVESSTGSQWVIRSEHPGERLGSFADKESAIEAARKIARERCGQLVVRRGENEIDFAEDFASVER